MTLTIVLAVLLVASGALHWRGWQSAKALLAANRDLTVALAEKDTPAALPVRSGFVRPPWAVKTPELPAAGSDGPSAATYIARSQLGCSSGWPEPPIGQEHGRLDVVALEAASIEREREAEQAGLVSAFTDSLEHRLDGVPGRVVSTQRVTKPGWLRETWDRVNGRLAVWLQWPGSEPTWGGA